MKVGTIVSASKKQKWKTTNDVTCNVSHLSYFNKIGTMGIIVYKLTIRVEISIQISIQEKWNDGQIINGWNLYLKLLIYYPISGDTKVRSKILTWNTTHK